MAIRVYLRLEHSRISDLRKRQVLRLPLPSGCAGMSPSRHLLQCSVVNAEHLCDLGVVDVVLDRTAGAAGGRFNHCNCLNRNLPLETVRAARVGLGAC